MANSDPFDLTDKVAIVTGGNGGLGLGIAMGLAGAGANIAIAARSVEKTAQALEDIRALGVEAHGITVDVTQEPAIQRMVASTIDHLGRLDILVNNSGIVVRAQPQDLSADQWDSVMDVNLRAAFLASKEVYSHMVEAGGGKIINVGSMYSIFGSDWGAPYAASKGGPGERRPPRLVRHRPDPGHPRRRSGALRKHQPPHPHRPLGRTIRTRRRRRLSRQPRFGLRYGRSIGGGWGVFGGVVSGRNHYLRYYRSR